LKTIVSRQPQAHPREAARETIGQEPLRLVV
jgi:hypothetical protein